MGFSVSRSAPVRINVEAYVRKLAAALPAIIRARVADGRDIRDKPFAPYTTTYAREQPTRRVDLDAAKAGGLMSTLVVKVQRTRDGAVIVVSPDAAHMAAGAALHRGTPTMHPRPRLGLSPRDLVVLRREVRT